MPDIELHIDETKVTVSERTSILDAAETLGIRIPTLRGPLSWI